MFRNKSLRHTWGRKEKGVSVFGTIKMEKRKSGGDERETQINFHPENCFENAENLFIFIRLASLRREKCQAFNNKWRNPFLVSCRRVHQLRDLHQLASHTPKKSIKKTNLKSPGNKTRDFSTVFQDSVKFIMKFFLLPLESVHSVGLGWIKYDFHSLLSIWKIWERLLRKREGNSKWKINLSTKGHFHNEVFRSLPLMTCHQEVFALQVDLQGFLAKKFIIVPTRVRESARTAATSIDGRNFQ